MKSETVQKLQSMFEALSQTIPDEGIEFWFARDLMVLGPIHQKCRRATFNLSQTGSGII